MREKMKAFLGILVAVVVLFSLSACDSSSTTPEASFYQLETEVLEGRGTVEISPDKDTYEEGDRVEIKAVPDENFNFVEWTGAINSSDKEETIVIDDDMTIGVVFEVDQNITGEGTEENPYRIYTAEGLQLMGEGNYSTNAFYELAKDIDLADIEWTPAGSFNDPPESFFSGSFDGKGNLIENMTIDHDDNFAGLFHMIYEGEVKNLTISNAEVETPPSAGEAGILAGQAIRSNISNVVVVESFISGGSNVGGLLGTLYEGIVENSSVQAEVEGEDNLGGIVGGINAEAVISNSFFDGSVYGDACAGGLAGWSSGTGDDSEIKNSYALGTVSAVNYIGGLVGDNAGYVTNSYAAVEINMRDSEGDSGGAIGINYGTIEGVYYDKQLSGMDDEGKGEPKTTQEMMTKSTFSEWDFEEVWAIEDGYPFLQ